MTPRIPLDPEPWINGHGTRSATDGTDQRPSNDMAGWNCSRCIRRHAPRPVIFASTDPATHKNRHPLNPWVPSHPANPILVVFRQESTSATITPESLDAWMGAYFHESVGIVVSPFGVAHARAVLTRLGNVDWEGWRA